MTEEAKQELKVCECGTRYADMGGGAYGTCMDCLIDDPTSDTVERLFNEVVRLRNARPEAERKLYCELCGALAKAGATHCECGCPELSAIRPREYEWQAERIAELEAGLVMEGNLVRQHLQTIDEQKKRIAELERMAESLRAELSKHQESEFNPDWSMLEATRDALKEYQGEVERLRDALDRIAALPMPSLAREIAREALAQPTTASEGAN